MNFNLNVTMMIIQYSPELEFNIVLTIIISKSFISSDYTPVKLLCQKSKYASQKFAKIGTNLNFWITLVPTRPCELFQICPDCPENLSRWPEKLSRWPENLSRWPENLSQCPENLSRRPEKLSRCPEKL